MNYEILIQAKKTVEEFKSQPLYLEYRLLEENILLNYSDLISEFKSIEEKYFIARQHGGKHHPNYMDLSQRLGELKTKFSLKSEVARFFVVERLLNQQLLDISDEINSLVSQYVPKRNIFGQITKGRC